MYDINIYHLNRVCSRYQLSHFSISYEFGISQINFSRIIVQSMHVRDQALTIRGSIFHELCPYNLEISQIRIP